MGSGIGENPRDGLGEIYARYVRAAAERTHHWANYHLERGLVAITGVPTPRGEDVNVRARLVLPSAGEIRNKTKDRLTDEQLAAMRPVAVDLGVGRKSTILPVGLGIPGRYLAATEGGLEWKMKAEIVAAVRDRNAINVTVCASEHVIATPGEIENMAKMYGANPGDTIGPNTYIPTQFGMAEFHTRNLTGFEAQESVHMFGYDIRPGYQRNGEQGALRTVGFAPDESGDWTEVRLLKIGRENYLNGDKPAYRYQPDTGDVVGILSDAYRILDKDFETPLAFFTTPTYPSRELGVARASVESGRLMVVPTVGADAIALAKGERPPSADVALDKLMPQVPGELHVLAGLNIQLGQLLAALGR